MSLPLHLTNLDTRTRKVPVKVAGKTRYLTIEGSSTPSAKEIDVRRIALLRTQEPELYALYQQLRAAEAQAKKQHNNDAFIEYRNQRINILNHGQLGSVPSKSRGAENDDYNFSQASRQGSKSAKTGREMPNQVSDQARSFLAQNPIKKILTTSEYGQIGVTPTPEEWFQYQTGSSLRKKQITAELTDRAREYAIRSKIKAKPVTPGIDYDPRNFTPETAMRWIDQKYGHMDNYAQARGGIKRDVMSWFQNAARRNFTRGPEVRELRPIAEAAYFDAVGMSEQARNARNAPLKKARQQDVNHRRAMGDDTVVDYDPSMEVEDPREGQHVRNTADGILGGLKTFTRGAANRISNDLGLGDISPEIFANSREGRFAESVMETVPYLIPGPHQLPLTFLQAVSAAGAIGENGLESVLGGLAESVNPLAEEVYDPETGETRPLYPEERFMRLVNLVTVGSTGRKLLKGKGMAQVRQMMSRPFRRPVTNPSSAISPGNGPKLSPNIPEGNFTNQIRQTFAKYSKAQKSLDSDQEVHPSTNTNSSSWADKNAIRLKELKENFRKSKGFGRSNQKLRMQTGAANTRLTIDLINLYAREVLNYAHKNNISIYAAISAFESTRSLAQHEKQIINKAAIELLPSTTTPREAYASPQTISNVAKNADKTGVIALTHADPAAINQPYINKQTGANSTKLEDFLYSLAQGGPGLGNKYFDSDRFIDQLAWATNSPSARKKMHTQAQAAGGDYVLTFKSALETVLGSHGFLAFEAERQAAGISWAQIEDIMTNIARKRPKLLVTKRGPRPEKIQDFFSPTWGTFPQRVALYKSILGPKLNKGLYWQDSAFFLTDPSARGYRHNDLMNIVRVDSPEPHASPNHPTYQEGVIGENLGYFPDITSLSDLHPGITEKYIHQNVRRGEGIIPANSEPLWKMIEPGNKSGKLNIIDGNVDSSKLGITPEEFWVKNALMLAFLRRKHRR